MEASPATKLPQVATSLIKIFTQTTLGPTKPPPHPPVPAGSEWMADTATTQDSQGQLPVALVVHLLTLNLNPASRSWSGTYVAVFLIFRLHG